MRKRLGRILVMQAVLAFVVTAAACNKLKKNNDAVGQGPNPGFGMAGKPGGPGGKRGPIADIMAKLTKGPQSLNNVIGRELNESTPPWDAIQPQTKEFVQLASSMSKYDPPKGEKDSWQKKTAEFAKSATDLDQAAKAKNIDAARAAHHALGESCKSCHQAHRAGPGGMGMPPGGFRGPGGPPQ